MTAPRPKLAFPSAVYNPNAPDQAEDGLGVFGLPGSQTINIASGQDAGISVGPGATTFTGAINFESHKGQHSESILFTGKNPILQLIPSMFVTPIPGLMPNLGLIKTMIVSVVLAGALGGLLGGGE